VGFAVLLRPSGGACEFDGLFVEPAHMGAGVGRALIDDARRIRASRAPRGSRSSPTPRRPTSTSGSALPTLSRPRPASGRPLRMRLTV
jgi:hypothetical protein